MLGTESGLTLAINMVRLGYIERQGQSHIGVDRSFVRC